MSDLTAQTAPAAPLALKDDRASGDGASVGYVSQPQADEITASQLGIDCEIKQRKVTQVAGQL